MWFFFFPATLLGQYFACSVQLFLFFVNIFYIYVFLTFAVPVFYFLIFFIFIVMHQYTYNLGLGSGFIGLHFRNKILGEKPFFKYYFDGVNWKNTGLSL